ncbi:ComEC/Rec2 family competence protein [Nocardioides sp. LHG3406-4]|uniref:ComEC/Rec2 family competence protein n=1 Tax=Nocardioides sp. LHG3406-4 TaxID=2804575 RepID=UPI003CF3A8FF
MAVPGRVGVPDLRMPVLGLAAWAGGLVGVLRPTWVPVVATTGALIVGLMAWRRSRAVRSWLAVTLVLVAVAGLAVVRGERVGGGPVAALAEEGAVVAATIRVTADPREKAGRFAPYVVARGRVTELTGRGRSWRVDSPVVVIGDAQWAGLALGSTVRTTGRLAPADGDAAAVVSARGSPAVVGRPDVWWRGAGAVRASMRDAVEPRSAEAQALVPALVVGDDARVDDALAADFRTTGLTHLLAVSGTNLTLLVGFVVLFARWVGVRGRWIQLVAALGIVGFVLLARTEPSVLRAAVMGAVGLVAMGSNGREQGSRALGVAVVLLLLVDPWLATTAGFALSVLATAGILFLAPGWRDALSCWLPRWLAAAIAIPAAAQAACTPVVAALSGQVSLVAVLANLLAAPAIGPATVLGLAGGLLALVWLPLGQVVAAPAAWCVGWIVVVARRGAALPTAALDWGAGPWALVLLTVLTVVVVALAPRLLRSPVSGIGCCLLLVVTVVTRPPTPGWPPDGWVVAACDVGQGDALLLRAGPGSAVVVDAGPDPVAVDRCLHRFDVDSVPLVVLTHFHADHVDGLGGVLRGRSVGEVVVTSLADPPEAVAAVRRLAEGRGIEPAVTAYDRGWRVGDVRLQAVWPVPGPPPSGPNDASVVMVAEVAGVRVLLTGDVEPEAQRRLAGTLAGLRVDVLKVPHHGSRYQDLSFLEGLRARVALVSVGVDNDYGHPAAQTLEALADAGARVLRTDLDGDLVVTVRDGRLGTLTDH